jgi:hypothetical protein
MSKSALNKAAILEVKDISIEKVEVPEWGGYVYVKGLTGSERDQFEASLVTGRGKESTVNMANIRAKLISLTICDEAGVRLFAEADAPAIGKKSAAALQRIFEVAQRLSRIGNDDIKELSEGLKTDPFEVSPLDSPLP